MAGVVSAVINKAVDISANMILEESHRLDWLQEDVRWLEREMRHMECYLQQAEAKEFTNPNVVNLIKDIRDLVHDAEDILDTYCIQIESNGLLKRMSTCFFPYCWSSSVFSREIEKLKRRVEGIDADRTRYGIVEDISSIDGVSNVDPRTTRLHVDDPIIVGFEQDIKDLKSKLEKAHPFVSIVGMAGIGKTTLAKKVFKGIKDDFDCSALVAVFQKPNLASLVQDIAKQVGMSEIVEKSEMNLYSFLQGKRYVIFLDDIWDIKAWDSLKGCFPIDSEGNSKLIITSRDSGVGRYIGGENSLHQLHPFDYSKSWELLSKSINIPSLELEMIGRKIVKKCDGVPLAIVVIVGMLRERGMSEFSWNRVLHSIGETTSDYCSQILSLSYRDLPTYLKPCFRYLGNFPEGYEFSASQIIRLWMAEKFIPYVGGEWELEDEGVDYISKLEARNLIQVVKRKYDGRINKFRIHDLLHSFCVNMGREIDFLSTIDHLESISAKRVRRLAGNHQCAAGNEKLIYQMTKLRAMFHVKFHNEIDFKCLNNMFGRLKLLQVLILYFAKEYVYIPSQIGSLSQLHHLQIQSFLDCFVIPSSIRNLQNLQTLDFQGCSVTELPTGIWKMEQLRHLCLVGYAIHSTQLLHQYEKQVQVFLPNLQTLIVNHYSDLKPTWLLKFTNLRKLVLKRVTREIVDVLTGPDPISTKLESLRCLSVFCIEISRMSLEKYERLKKLDLRGLRLPMQQPLELPPNLIKLTLEDTHLIEDPMKILKDLRKLKFLCLGGDSYVGSKMECTGADSFPQLEILILEGLKNLEELIGGDERGMPRLTRLEISHCCRLVHILGSDSFPNLRNLALHALRNLEFIEGDEMGMPKLTELKIRCCDRLVQIPERFQQLRMTS